MKIPARLIPLVEDGIIDEVLAQVKSGKEADVFVVRVGEAVRCAKVYKEANNRSFRQAVQYQEGRKVQNSRSSRAMSKRTKYGQKEAEASWINAEVEALNKLSAVGIRVPTPFGFFDGVLIMELILGEDGQPAPRLNDISLNPDTALLYHEEIISQIVRMLCAGIIHGDLSEFNVLVDAEGPVIIDLPQAVNAAGNNSAGMMFARDVDNMARYFGRFEPGILGLKYAKEIWDLYQKGKLTPHTVLTGKYQEPTKSADVHGVLNAIGDARKEHEDKAIRKAQNRESLDPNQPPKRWTPREDRPANAPRSNQGQPYGGRINPQSAGPHSTPRPQYGNGNVNNNVNNNDTRNSNVTRNSNSNPNANGYSNRNSTGNSNRNLNSGGNQGQNSNRNYNPSRPNPNSRPNQNNQANPNSRSYNNPSSNFNNRGNSQGPVNPNFRPNQPAKPDSIKPDPITDPNAWGRRPNPNAGRSPRGRRP
jgi:RIO kinase 1